MKLTVGDEEMTKTIQVEEDPRITLTAKERKALFETQMRLGGLSKTAAAAQRSLQGVRTQVVALQAKDGMKSAPKPLTEAVTALSSQVDKLQARLALRGGPAAGDGCGGGPGGPGAVPARAALVVLALAQRAKGRAAKVRPVPADSLPSRLRQRALRRRRPFRCNFASPVCSMRLTASRRFRPAPL